MESAKLILSDNDIPEEEKGDANVLVAEAEELKKWVDELTPLQETIVMMRDGLKTLFLAGENQLKVENTKLAVIEQKFASVNGAWGAIKQARGLFGANEGKRNEYELSIKEANRNIAEKLANIDSFMEMTKPLIRRAAINDKLADANVQKIIEQIKTGQFKKMVNDFESEKLHLQATSPNILETAAIGRKMNNYDELLKK